MSNYDLQMKLSQLQSQLREAEQINAELRRELSTVEYGVNQADRELENYNRAIRNTLDNCNNVMLSSHRRVLDSIEVQYEIEKMYVRFKQIELANKKIREANNKKYYDFANFRTVRKIVQGVMDNLDVNMVSNQAITKSVEKQHLQTPDYWLTCVLLSIMAWRSDDRELAERAIDRALSLDKKNSAVFYMLFNLRMHRNDAALKWFYTYQDCPLKGSDQRTFLMLFSLVARTLSESDEADSKIREEVFSFIRKVIAANMKASGYSEEDIVGQVGQYLRRMQISDPMEYTALRRYCTGFNELTEVMSQAKNNINILEFFRQVVNVPPEQKNTFLKDFIGELIDAPNAVEEDVYNTIAYNETIIRCNGDVETAREIYEAEQTHHKNDLNLIAEMIDWIYKREAQEVNGQIRLNMFTLTKDFQEKAVDQAVEAYRKRRRTAYDVTIGDYSTTVNFQKEHEECEKAAAFYEGKRDTALADIKNWKAFLSFGLGAAALVGAFFLGFGLLVVTAGCLLCGGGILLTNRGKIRQLHMECENNIRGTQEILRKLFADFEQYQKDLNEYDAYYEQIKDELRKV